MLPINLHSGIQLENVKFFKNFYPSSLKSFFHTLWQTWLSLFSENPRAWLTTDMAELMLWIAIKYGDLMILCRPPFHFCESCHTPFFYPPVYPPGYPSSYPQGYLMLPNLTNQFIKLSNGDLQCEWNSEILFRLKGNNSKCCSSLLG